MGANNSNLNPEWQPQPDPNEAPLTWIWRKKATEYIYELRGMASNLNQTVQNFNNNVTQQITKIVEAASANAANAANNNNATTKPPVIFGFSGIMWSNYPPNLWTGYLFVQADRNAAYYSNGSAWVALEGIGTGSFETRWTGLNTHDAGLLWIETSRNNISGLPPYPEYQWSGANWNFLSGEFYRNQANLAVLAATFASANSNNGNDVGARVNVTDFRGQLQWTNANNSNGWALGPDDDDEHGMGPFFGETDRTGTWWQLYGGSNNVSYLKSDGTTGNVNLPNLSGNNAGNSAFLESGQVNSGINPAVAPVFTGNPASGSITGSFTGTGTGTANSTSANNFNTTLGIATAVTSVGAVSVTVSGNVAGNLAGNNATGTISNNGQPASLVRRAWFRR